ncbi:MAG: hypothetical protein LBJ47_08065 [Tannerella sp.]|nr:hypothetical protein [Tannerella sp.]
MAAPVRRHDARIHPLERGRRTDNRRYGTVFLRGKRHIRPVVLHAQREESDNVPIPGRSGREIILITLKNETL